MKTSDLFAKMFAEPGFKIRSKKWESNEYWYFNSNENRIVDDAGSEVASIYFHKILGILEDWEPYIETPKKVKKTFYRAICLYKTGTMINCFSWYLTKEEATEDVNEDWKIIDWEEKEFEVDENSNHSELL